jgi:hypothetical protein
LYVDLMENETMTTTTESNTITTDPTGSSISSITENGKENENNTKKKRPPKWLQTLDLSIDCSGGRIRSTWANRNYYAHIIPLDTTPAKPLPCRKSRPLLNCVPPTAVVSRKKQTKKGEKEKKSKEKKEPPPTTTLETKTLPNNEEEDHQFESFFDFCEKEEGFASTTSPLRDLYRRFRASPQQQEEKSIVVPDLG